MNLLKDLTKLDQILLQARCEDAERELAKTAKRITELEQELAKEKITKNQRLLVGRLGRLLFRFFQL